MNERQVRKVRKNRHMTEIMLNIAANSVFKNLSLRDRTKLAKIVYKAEMIEFFIREKSITNVNSEFQKLIADVLRQVDVEDLPEDEDPFAPFDD